MKRHAKCVGKRAYSHRDKAEKVALKMYQRNETKMAVYECPTCLDFHLTSKWTNLEHLYKKLKTSTVTKRAKKRHNLKRNRATRNKNLQWLFSQIDYSTYLWKTIKLLS